MIQRNVTAPLLAALADTPVVVLHGARQTGKSTLVKTLIAEGYPARYLTLDDSTALAAVRHDPAGFIAGMQDAGERLVIDEVQRAPELFLPIKAEVDRDRRPGRFLLTGSANVLFIPRLAETLAGRVEILTLYPLSQDELDGLKASFVDAIFADRFQPTTISPLERTQLLSRILAGGYPEAVTRTDEQRRNAWYRSYIDTILQRDVRDMANIEGLFLLPRLLTLLAARSASLINTADLARSIALPQTTLKRYLALLQATFLMQTVPAWSGNLGKRLAKAPKLTLCDTGLLAYLLGINYDRLALNPDVTGPLLESFVIMELYKQLVWSSTNPHLFHFRTQTGQEVDIVLENMAGQVAGIEVKASATVGARDFRGLAVLAQELGANFVRGVVFYTGSEVVPFSKDMWALPLGALWRMSI
jgi:predicted AAA+ superfamily ATPase